MSTLGSGAVLNAGETASVVDIYGSTFMNNSAYQGAVFNIESSSVVSCTNCVIQNNYAITSGIVGIANSGYFKFYKTTIASNFGTNYLISVLFDSVNLSTLNN